jgi:endonuclease/exonuclease/phosphatase (EEP) superfamily protein YafD
VRSLVAIAVAIPWVVWALVRTLGLKLGYPLVTVVAFTPYAALTSPLPVIAGLLLRRRVIAGVSAVAAAALGFAVLPRAIAGPEPDAAGPRLVVMTSNLYLGQADAGAVLRVAREHRVDVLSLQELRPWLLEAFDGAGGRELFPYKLLERGISGSGVLTREQVRTLPGLAAPFPGQPEVELTVPGAPAVRVMAVHPSPPVNDAAESGWRALMQAFPAPAEDGPVHILAGDFNATLDHAELRELLDRGYVDAADAAGKGLVWTWPALRRRRALPVTIDHVLVDRRVRVERVSVVRIPGSDHRAVIAELRLPRQ